MQLDSKGAPIAVFDIGGTWFRWGIFDPVEGLSRCERVAAINYLAYPDQSAQELQASLLEFIVDRVEQIRGDGNADLRSVCISLGAPVNARDMTVWGSGPLWGPSAKPCNLYETLQKALPELEWHVVNDVTALLANYMPSTGVHRKTMLITVSSGIGSRLYDHRTRRIPYDDVYGIQGEIGHLPCVFELSGTRLDRCCECGGWNHMNAFSSGRGIAATLRELSALGSDYPSIFDGTTQQWLEADDEYRARAFSAALSSNNAAAVNLLDAFVTPLSRAITTALALDPEIDRIVMTGGVVQGLGIEYRNALQRVFIRDGLYQITPRDPDYLSRRLLWSEADDFAGLRGAGVYVTQSTSGPMGVMT